MYAAASSNVIRFLNSIIPCHSPTPTLCNEAFPIYFLVAPPDLYQISYLQEAPRITMAFEDVMNAIRDSVQESLDELTSPRSLFKAKTKALQNLEQHLATACCSTATDSEARDSFLALQHTFECNVPAHLLSWITLSTLRLESLTTKTSGEDDKVTDVDELATQFSLSLSLIQGIALNHEPSKRYLGRRRAVEVLLDLLLASRHLASPSDNAESQRKSTPNPPHLTSIVLDTLLCILVDSTLALRTFEETNGVQAVVKILKRAGTPREVRMKCLEFLYFYLLDETPTTSSSPSVSSTTPQSPLLTSSKATQPTPPPTAPTTPIRPAKPYFSGAPMRPSNSSRYGSSTFAFSSSSSGISVSGSRSGSGSTAPFEPNSSRSTSNSSTKSAGSFSSTSSNASLSSGTSVSGGSRSGSPSINANGGHEKIKEKERVVSPVFMESIKVLPKSPVKRMGTPFAAGHGHGHSRSQSQHQLQLQRNATPPNSPPLGSPPSNTPSGVRAGNKFPQLQPRSMMMLRKEVDYVPLSPKKLPSLSGALAEGHSNGRRPSALGHHKSLSMSSTSTSGSPFQASRLGSGATSPPPSEGGHGRRGVGKSASEPSVLERQADKNNRDGGKGSKWKTTEEKKELLGTMLGNVDALVEGVRKAGIWGLG
ncbi:unnamed protein product [Cyclocybe aegerita]|uniref:Cell division control protein 14 n=1 Tax=Cyclocybe aegerita TaxID=1973307 RepID=A0A8S0WUA3_CYCAE|nr:unnamed protein product [Cyclocybe aegerita]